MLSRIIWPFVIEIVYTIPVGVDICKCAKGTIVFLLAEMIRCKLGRIQFYTTWFIGVVHGVYVYSIVILPCHAFKVVIGFRAKHAHIVLLTAHDILIRQVRCTRYNIKYIVKGFISCMTFHQCQKCSRHLAISSTIRGGYVSTPKRCINIFIFIARGLLKGAGLWSDGVQLPHMVKFVVKCGILTSAHMSRFALTLRCLCWRDRPHIRHWFTIILFCTLRSVRSDAKCVIGTLYTLMTVKHMTRTTIFYAFVCKDTSMLSNARSSTSANTMWGTTCIRTCFGKSFITF